MNISIQCHKYSFSISDSIIARHPANLADWLINIISDSNVKCILLVFLFPANDNIFLFVGNKLNNLTVLYLKKEIVTPAIS